MYTVYALEASYFVRQKPRQSNIAFPLVTSASVFRRRNEKNPVM